MKENIVDMKVISKYKNVDMIQFCTKMTQDLSWKTWTLVCCDIHILYY